MKKRYTIVPGPTFDKWKEFPLIYLEQIWNKFESIGLRWVYEGKRI